MNSAEVLIKFDGDTKGADKATKSVTSSLGQLTKAFTLGSLASKGISKGIQLFTENLGSAISRTDTLNNFPKVMSNLGISAEDSAEVIDDLSKKLQGLPTSIDSAAMAVQRFTSKNGNVKESEKIFLAVNNAILSGGASADIQASALEQLSQAYAKGKPDMMEWRTLMTAMPAQLKQVATAMGYVDADALGSALRDGSLSMDDFINTMIKMNTEGVAGFKSFEEQARNSTGGIGTSITNMKTAFVRGIAGIISKVDEALAPLGGITGVITTIGKVGEQAFSLIGDVLKDVLPTLIEVGKEIMPTIKKSIKSVMPVIQKLAKALLPALTKVIQKLVPVIAQIIEAVLPIVIKLLDAIIPLLDPIANFLLAWIDYIMALITPLMQILQVILPPIIDMLSGLAQIILPMITAVLKTVTGVIKTSISVIEGIIKTSIDVIKAIITPIIEFVKLIIEGIKTAINPIIEFAQGVFTNIYTKVQSTINKIKSVILPIVSWVKNNVLNPAYNTFKTIFTNISNFIKTTFNTIKSTISTVFNFIKNNIVSPVANFFEGTFNSIKTAAETVFNGISDVVSNIFNGLVSIVKAPLNLIIDAINTVIRGLNKISIKIPKWVPGVGGQKWGINIGEVPRLEVGTNYVPEDTLAMIHQGEAVVPKKFNPYANGMNSSMLGMLNNSRGNQVINVYANFKQDNLGQVVRDIKTFSGGARNDYNYGAGV